MVPPALQQANFKPPITGSANPYYTWLLYGNGSSYDSFCKTETNCSKTTLNCNDGCQRRSDGVQLGVNGLSRGISKTKANNNSCSILNIAEDSSWSLDDVINPNSTDTSSDNVNVKLDSIIAADDVDDVSWPEVDDDDAGLVGASPTATALKVVQISNPVRVKTDVANFRSLVQRLTGKSPDCTKYWRKLRRMNSRQGVVDVQGDATLQILDSMVDDDATKIKFTQHDADDYGGPSKLISYDTFSDTVSDQLNAVFLAANHGNVNNNIESVDDLIIAGLDADRPLPDITMLPPLHQSNMYTNNGNNLHLQPSSTTSVVEHLSCANSFLHNHSCHRHHQAVTPTR